MAGAFGSCRECMLEVGLVVWSKGFYGVFCLEVDVLNTGRNTVRTERCAKC